MCCVGSKLRNTAYIYGIAVYCGQDTKLFRNLQLTTSKMSGTQKRLNVVVLSIFVFNVVLLVVAGILAGVYQKSETSKMTYMDSIANENDVEVRSSEFSKAVLSFRCRSGPSIC